MSLFRSLSNSLTPIHREGFPFIASFFILSVILGWIWFPLFWLGLVITAWSIYFFRDPVRVTPIAEGVVVSPADGRISWVGAAIPPKELGLGDEELIRISIFMNIFSVHINRIPINGTISAMAYRPGKFANAELDKASDSNERNSMVITSAYGNLAVVQIAGLVARRILCWVQLQDQVTTGQRFGLIRFGSRLDIYLPKGIDSVVGVGQTALAGETILAYCSKKTAINEFTMD